MLGKSFLNGTKTLWKGGQRYKRKTEDSTGITGHNQNNTGQ